MEMKPKRELGKITQKKINKEALSHNSTRQLYQNGLLQNINEELVNETKDKIGSWKNMNK